MPEREALFYQKEAQAIRCELCYRRCRIKDGAFGFCGTRKNSNGTLYAMTYGKPCCYGADPVEKKPFYHFWPGSMSFSLATVGCNFRCLHCQNYDISQAKAGELPEYELPPEKIIALAKEQRCQGIAYTYTEPTVFFEYCYDIGMKAKKEKLYNVFVTNGYMTPEPIKKTKDFLDAARIDLKGNDEHYRRVCGARLEHVLECIKNLHKTGMHIEIITLLIPDDNDDKDTITMLGGFIKGLSDEIPWHFTRFHPAYKMLNKAPTAIAKLEQAYEWAKELGIKYVYTGNVLGHVHENTFCHNCDTQLIERSGFSIREVNLVKKGDSYHCPSCGEKIPIVGDVVKQPEIHSL